MNEIQNPIRSQEKLEASLLSRETISQSLIGQQKIAQIKKNTARLNSLDVYRGLTMFGMLMANSAGMNPPDFLQHAEWNGLTPVDLVFPSFLFILGMAVPLAVTTSKPLRLKNILRIIGLFGIGLFLYLMDARFNFTILRIPGVLQRMSICYGLVILIHWATQYGKPQKRIFGFLTVLSGFLIYISYMLSFQNSQIGCNKANNLQEFCNFQGYLDRMIFGKDHMIYPTDPEGPFSNLSSLVTTYFGYYFCLIMKDHKNEINKTLKKWFIISFILGLTVYPLTRIMPINKKLYSASFAFLTSSVSGFSIFLCVIGIDILPSKNWNATKVVDFITTPFIWLGRNPLFVYVFSQIIELIVQNYVQIGDSPLCDVIEKYLLQSWIGENAISTVINKLLYVIIYTLICGILFKKQIFIRL